MSQSLRTCLIAATISLLAASLAAQEWHPPAPEAGAKDWVRLKSGEWIRGTIDLVRDLSMEFDSDDLDDLKIDWSDIAAFRSPRILTYAFTDDRVVTGTGSMKDGIITVTSADGTSVEFPRRELMAVIEGEPKEINYWSAKMTLGTTVRAGNTDQKDAQTILKIKRDSPKARLDAGYTGNFGEVNSEPTVDNHRFDGGFSLFVSRKFFVTVPFFEFFSDEFQNINLRSTAGVGAGYYIYRQSKIDWSVGLGGAYQRNTFDSVEEGEDDATSTGAIIPNTTLEWDVTSDLELDIDYRSQVSVPDPKNSIHYVMGLMTIDFFRDIFELSSSVTWDRVENPVANADGVVPERDDFRFYFGFGIDL